MYQFQSINLWWLSNSYIYFLNTFTSILKFDFPDNLYQINKFAVPHLLFLLQIGGVASTSFNLMALFQKENYQHLTSVQLCLWTNFDSFKFLSFPGPWFPTIPHMYLVFLFLIIGRTIIFQLIGNKLGISTIKLQIQCIALSLNCAPLTAIMKRTVKHTTKE